MDVMYCDVSTPNSPKYGRLSHFEVEFEVGDEMDNTFVISQSVHNYVDLSSAYVYINGTEYGGPVRGVEFEGDEVKFFGPTWRGKMDEVLVSTNANGYTASQGTTGTAFAARLFRGPGNLGNNKIHAFRYYKYHRAGIVGTLTESGLKIKVDKFVSDGFKDMLAQLDWTNMSTMEDTTDAHIKFSGGDNNGNRVLTIDGESWDCGVGVDYDLDHGNDRRSEIALVKETPGLAIHAVSADRYQFVLGYDNDNTYPMEVNTAVTDPNAKKYPQMVVDVSQYSALKRKHRSMTKEVKAKDAEASYTEVTSLPKDLDLELYDIFSVEAPTGQWLDLQVTGIIYKIQDDGFYQDVTKDYTTKWFEE